MTHSQAQTLFDWTRFPNRVLYVSIDGQAHQAILFQEGVVGFYPVGLPQVHPSILADFPLSAVSLMDNGRSVKVSSVI